MLLRLPTMSASLPWCCMICTDRGITLQVCCSRISRTVDWTLTFTEIHGILYPKPTQHNWWATRTEHRRSRQLLAFPKVPKKKLIVGIPTYGRTFTIWQYKSEWGRSFRNRTGSTRLGSFVPEAAFLRFIEICYKRCEWTHHWQKQQKLTLWRIINGLDMTILNRLRLN